MIWGQNKRFFDKINDLGTTKMISGQSTRFWDNVNHFGTK